MDPRFQQPTKPTPQPVPFLKFITDNEETIYVNANSILSISFGSGGIIDIVYGVHSFSTYQLPKELEMFKKEGPIEGGSRND